jgi:hypothetical protein
MPTSVILISRYSDTIIVIKKESNNYIQYVGDLYSEPVSLSYDTLCDLFDTSGTVLVFYHHQVFITVLVASFICSWGDSQM